jgi:hypothetical protein
MRYVEIYEDGVKVRVEAWDDTTRQVTVYEADGKTVIVPTRPYTVDENELADDAAAVKAAETSARNRVAAVKLVVTDLQAEKTRVQRIIDTDNALLKVGDVKDVARAAKRIADAAIDIARLLTE